MAERTVNQHEAPTAGDCAVMMPVGPGEAEVDRALDTASSLLAWEPRVRWLVLVDDHPAERGLADRIAARPGVEVLALRSPRHDPQAAKVDTRGLIRLGCTCTADLTGLRWIAEHAPGAITVRLDTDALVIAPFAEKLAAAFKRHPDVGIFGLYDYGLNGLSHQPAFRGWRRATSKLGAPVRIYRRPPIAGRRLEQALWGAAAATRRQFRRARSNGYQSGENILAAACALAPSMTSAMAAAGDLDDPMRWLTAPVSDDIMLAIAAFAVGYRLGSLSADSEPFGLMHVGLGDTPERLLDRGFSFIHSVKNDSRFAEAEIRDFFAQRRPTGA